VNAAVENVHHGNRQQVRIDAADISIKRQSHRVRRGLCGCKADSQDRVRSKAALVLSSVEGDHRLVEPDLVFGVEPDDLVCDLAVNCGDGLSDALAAPSALVSVPHLDRLVSASRSARRNSGPAHASILQGNIDFDSGIAPAVENLARVDIDDRSHGFPSCGGVTIWV
jgi:hypothetical protein